MGSINLSSNVTIRALLASFYAELEKSACSARAACAYFSQCTNIKKKSLPFFVPFFVLFYVCFFAHLWAILSIFLTYILCVNFSGSKFCQCYFVIFFHL